MTTPRLMLAVPVLLLAACGGSDDNEAPLAAPPQLAKAVGATRQACAELATTAFTFANTRVATATLQAAGTLGGIATGEHCLVTGVMHERTGVNGSYAIGFEARLPTQWN